MSSALLAQQYGAVLLRHNKVATQDAWQWWTPEQIAVATLAPVEAVRITWPLVYAALEHYGIATYNTCRGALGTMAVETAHTLLPVREAFWLSEEWRRLNLRYYPWYGRGYIQLTWESNYDRYGRMIGVDLLTNPDRAMEPAIAALVFGAYFWANVINDACDSENWTECRRLVQGAYAGLPDMLSVVNQLAVVPTF